MSCRRSHARFSARLRPRLLNATIAVDYQYLPVHAKTVVAWVQHINRLNNGAASVLDAADMLRHRAIPSHLAEVNWKTMQLFQVQTRLRAQSKHEGVESRQSDWMWNGGKRNALRWRRPVAMLTKGTNFPAMIAR